MNFASGRLLHGAREVFVSLQTSKSRSSRKMHNHCACQLACLCLVSWTLTFDVVHAGSLVTCPTLCPLQFLLFTLLIGNHKCVSRTVLMSRMKSSSCKVIFMRMISPSVKHTPLEFERFCLLFSSCQRVALRSMTGVCSRRLLTLQLSALVFWRWGCVLVYRTACWFHWNLQLLPWRSELWR